MIHNGFGFGRGQKTTKPPEEQDILAALLANHSPPKTGQPRNLSRWAMDFAQLIREHGSEVRRVLVWTLENQGKPGIPTLTSARKFRQSFVQLCKLRSQQAGIASPEAQGLAKHFLSGFWPNGLDQMLPGLIHASLIEYQQVHSRLCSLANLPRPLSACLDYLLCVYLIRPRSFVEGWFQEVQQDLWRWGSYSGRPETLAFSEDSPRFHRTARGYAYSYCGDSSRWDRLWSMAREN